MPLNILLNPEQARLAGLQVWELDITGWGNGTLYATDPTTLAYGKYPTSPPLLVVPGGPIPPGNASQFTLPPAVALSIAPKSTVDVVRFFPFPPFVQGFPSIASNVPLLSTAGNLLSVERPFVGQVESPMTFFQYNLFGGPLPPNAFGPRGAATSYIEKDPPGGVRPFASSPVFQQPRLVVQFHLRNPPAALAARTPFIRQGSYVQLVNAALEDAFIIPVGGRKHIRVMVTPEVNAATVQLTGIEMIVNSGAYKECTLTAPAAVAGNASTAIYLNNQEVSWLVLKSTANAGTVVRYNIEAID